MSKPLIIKFLVTVLRELWCCVGRRVKHEQLVLSNELKVELPPRKIWKADVSTVSPSSER